MSYTFPPDSTDVSVVIRIVDAADGTPETGVTSATSGLDLKYRREGAAAASLTESDLSALTDAHSDGGLLHIGAGYYRLDLPDAALATGAAGVLVFGDVADMVVLGCYIQLATWEAESFTVDDVADAVWDEAQAGHVGAGTFGAYLDAAVSASGSLAVQDIVDGVWDEDQTSHVSAGSFGAYLDAAVSSRGTSDLTDQEVWEYSDRGLTDGVTVDGFATDAIDADALSADALTEIFTKIWTTALTESYAADGAAPTGAQAMFLIQQMLTEFGISSTTLTVNKLDGTTSAATFTLNDATSPTSITRAS